jgi:O-antigen/teichoic acid export membrane protein
MFVDNWKNKEQKLKDIYLSLKNEIRFTLITYLGIMISVISGVLLARYLGANARGTLAYYTSFILLACFVSSFNFSSGTARVMNQVPENQDKNEYLILIKVFCIGFLLSTAFACIVIFSGIIESENLKVSIFFFLIATGMAAISSYFEGIWTYQGKLIFITAARFLGLFVPAIFAIVLVLVDKATIEVLLLAQLLVLVANILLIYFYINYGSHTNSPDFNVAIMSAVRGMPAYLIEYLSFWFITYSIMHLDGATALGNYVIASSLASAADSIFGASRVKYYRSLIDQNIKNFQRLLVVLFRGTIPSLVLHLAFIPLALLIPMIYGSEFYSARKIAVFLLLSRIISICARTIVLFLVSIKKDGYSSVVYLSFLIPFLALSHFSEKKILGYYWTYAYLYASIVMLLTSLILLYSLSVKNRK